MHLRTSPTEARAFDHVMELIKQKEGALGSLACSSEIEIGEVDWPLAASPVYIKLEGEDAPWLELVAEVESRTYPPPAP